MVHGDTVFLIDFGLAQLFCNPATYLHVSLSTDSPDIGTLPFLSITSQCGFTQSCRDDLESLAYTIIYAARGDLPWMSIHADQEKILHMKLITAGELCEGLPTPFCKFVSYVHSLGFNEKPDYQLLHSIISQCSLATQTGLFDEQRPSLACPHVKRKYTPIFSDRV